MQQIEEPLRCSEDPVQPEQRKEYSGLYPSVSVCLYPVCLGSCLHPAMCRGVGLDIAMPGSEPWKPVRSLGAVVADSPHHPDSSLGHGA